MLAAGVRTGSRFRRRRSGLGQRNRPAWLPVCVSTRASPPTCRISSQSGSIWHSRERDHRPDSRWGRQCGGRGSSASRRSTTAQSLSRSCRRRRARRRSRPAWRCGGARSGSVVGHGCLEGVKTLVVDEVLAVVRLLQVPAGLRIRDADGERQAVAQGDLPVEQRDRLRGREAQPGEDRLGVVLESGLDARPDHRGLGHRRRPRAGAAYPGWGTAWRMRSGSALSGPGPHPRLSADRRSPGRDSHDVASGRFRSRPGRRAGSGWSSARRCRGGSGTSGRSAGACGSGAASRCVAPLPVAPRAAVVRPLPRGWRVVRCRWRAHQD